MKKWFRAIAFLFIVGVGLWRLSTDDALMRSHDQKILTLKDSSAWVGASLYQIPFQSKDGPLIQYGYELVAHTAKYLGPKGSVMQITNGMNCQNCHLEAGTKPWGINYGSVFSTYPKFRERSGSIETIYKRVNDCMERSLNGKALDTNSKEMKAIYAYIQWLGNEVPKGKKVKGSGIEILPYLKTAASPTEGKIVYMLNCQKCHLSNGEGVMDSTGKMYLYPPLWGKHSYIDAAGLFQLSKLAGFIKNNMPNGINYHTPSISNQDAWNVAAYINAQPRPSKNKSKDWPVLATKPVDYPFGPYADTFSEQQHKFGPFEPIALAKKNK
jgi:thiosulfate dehydrogenase